ncbi:neuropeptide FF receptor 2-like [Rhopilema esculentum]|uniref:neuropeptide FF receptor 2-like n=1 Tax=Rhopilema esculentum TaxID=499914 RepID=UPI0031DD7217|eukprot:gene16926-8415_t
MALMSSSVGTNNSAFQRTVAPNSSFAKFTGMAGLNYLHDELMLVDTISKYIALISIILSISGNIMVIICHIKLQIHYSYKCLIVNLAISDLLYSVMQIFRVHSRFRSSEWHFGRFLCKMMLLSPSSLTCSMFTMCFMAVDRFITIVYPFRPRLKIRKTIIVTTLLWIFAISIHAPFATKRDIVLRKGKTMCLYTWNFGDDDKKLYHLVSFSVTYPIPILIILISSINIVYTALKGVPKTAGKMHSGGGKSVNPFKKYRKLFLTFIGIFLVFIITTTPNQALILWLNFPSKTKTSFRSARYTFFILYMFAPLVHVHAWMNPLIYSFSDEKFRSALVQIVSWLWRRTEHDKSGVGLLNKSPYQKHTTNQQSNRRNTDTKTTAKT